MQMNITKVSVNLYDKMEKVFLDGFFWSNGQAIKALRMSIWRSHNSFDHSKLHS